MVKVHRLLRQNKAKLEEAVRRAEVGHDGEIVVVICKRAGNYGRQESIFAFLISILTLSIAWLSLQKVVPSSPWDTGPSVYFSLLYVVITLVIGFVLGQLLIGRFPKLVKPFVGRRNLRKYAENEAAVCFWRYRVSKTERRTGVLLFVAELERTVAVLGDEAIQDSVSDAEWELIRDCILEGIRGRDPVGGVLSGIEQAGNLLRTRIPSGSSNPNELSNAVYFR